MARLTGQLLSKLMCSKSNRSVSFSISLRFKTTKTYDVKEIIQLNYDNFNLYGPKLNRKSKKLTKSEEKSEYHTSSPIESNKQSEKSGKLTKSKASNKQINSDKEKLDKNSEESNKNNEKKGNKEIKVPFQRKIDPAIDYILTYPMVRSEAEVDNSVLVQSAGHLIPSVTRIISETMSDLSRFYLERWKKKMISELGAEGFKKHQEETFRNGSNLHANIQHFLSGIPESELNIYKDNTGHWDSIRRVLQDVKEAVAIEEAVKHKDLCYQGKFDCVAVYKDRLCLVDWKTSKKTKPTIKDTFDNPIQVAAYIGAINNSQLLQDRGMDQITNGAIVIAYPDGQPAHVHTMDQKLCEENWKIWLERLHMYWKKVRETKLKCDDKNILTKNL
ncbi:mitochondrial genome maintenance exonuclease 1-like [Mytilus californianus]|uniref:mitochondrial genome maintenance exonuclease 1-like n=1 Tax=Mytilus californianus TaxID=6549 RepID=UPI0022475F3F|nr:mitochondrial genome maintenance exonuclease 1-like [Mytilus californianus]XP_052106894.1 mitochondrial genome maintenance exonuclease 1-like [Mytilus californianus]XP_052106895.1 mitochondrial genome maintenance exonuclease 1-like [Mytilus californianus]